MLENAHVMSPLVAYVYTLYTLQPLTTSPPPAAVLSELSDLPEVAAAVEQRPRLRHTGLRRFSLGCFCAPLPRYPATPLPLCSSAPLLLSSSLQLRLFSPSLLLWPLLSLHSLLLCPPKRARPRHHRARSSTTCRTTRRSSWSSHRGPTCSSCAQPKR